jgi:hypothetical protein
VAELSAQAQKALKSLFEDGCVATTTRSRRSSARGCAPTTASSTRTPTPGRGGRSSTRRSSSTSSSRLSPRSSTGSSPTRSSRRRGSTTPESTSGSSKGAKAHEILHAAQLADDRFHETQTPFALQDAIAGITVAKTFWRRDVRDPAAAEGRPGRARGRVGIFLPRLVEEEYVDVCYDGPTTEVVNVEDFYWHEAATELQKSPVLAHAVWMHFSDLKRLEAQGQYQNVDELSRCATRRASTPTTDR